MTLASWAGGVKWLDALDPAAAGEALFRCCGSKRWVEAMLAERPFRTRDALERAADSVWSGLGPEDCLEAFAHHPMIGEDIAALRARFASTRDLSEAEQAGVTTADERTLLELRAANRIYRERFGFIFIVCASGKTAAEMLSLLVERLDHPPALELAVAKAEQAKITLLRLERLGT